MQLLFLSLDTTYLLQNQRSSPHQALSKFSIQVDSNVALSLAIVQFSQNLGRYAPDEHCRLDIFRYHTPSSNGTSLSNIDARINSYCITGLYIIPNIN